MNKHLPPVAARQFKLAVMWLLVGLMMGIAMAASHDFILSGVHAHVNLLGWATLALTGLVYAIIPDMAESRLAQWHFWLHNLGLPVMMAGLAAILFGHMEAEPVIALGAIAMTLGLILFAFNLFRRA